MSALAEPDLFHCPQCNGPADNGHDRSIPPNPYFCTKCMAEPVQEPGFWGRVSARQASRIKRLEATAQQALEFIRTMNQQGWMLADYEDDMERTVAGLEAALAEPVQEPVAGRAFLQRILTAMEGVIDVADRKTDEFDALRSCVIDLTMMLHATPPQREENNDD